MAVPKKRTTKSRRNNRRMHIYLKTPALTDCPNCKEKMRRHHLCQNCGHYNGRQIVDVMEEISKKETKKKESKKEEVKEKEEAKEKEPLKMENLSK